MPQENKASLTKRKRRTAQEIAAIEAAVVPVDRLRQQEHALEPAIGPLAPTILLLLGLGLRPALPAQNQPALNEFDLDIVFRHPGQLSFQDVGVLRLVNIGGRRPI